MDAELLRRLSRITPEEERILQGGSVERGAYTSAEEFTVDKDRMLESGKLIALRPHTRFAAFPRHSHNYVEIMYQCTGKTVHTLDSGQRIELHAGEILMLGLYASHEIERAQEEDIAVNFIVLPQFFDTALDMVGQDNTLGAFLAATLRGERGQGAYLHFRVSDVLPVQNLVENLVFSLVMRPQNRRSIERTTMGLLFLHLMNYTERIQTQTLPQYDNALVITVLRDIEENYRDSSLTELAQRLNQSVTRLSTLVHTATGKTYKQLLSQKRFLKAEALLTGSSMPVSEIIARVGYDNTSYFHREFLHRHGMSPGAYRKMYKS